MSTKNPTPNTDQLLKSAADRKWDEARLEIIEELSAIWSEDTAKAYVTDKLGPARLDSLRMSIRKVTKTGHETCRPNMCHNPADYSSHNNTEES